MFSRMLHLEEFAIAGITSRSFKVSYIMALFGISHMTSYLCDFPIFSIHNMVAGMKNKILKNKIQYKLFK